MAHGYTQTSICAPPPPSPPNPPQSPSPSPPCACSNTCQGLVDDGGGTWTRNGIVADNDGSGRIVQTAQFGWCDTTVDGACLPVSAGGSGPVSFANNGICEDGGSGSAHEEDYFMCTYYGGDLDTPYCTNRRDNGGIVNHGLNTWWLPCASAPTAPTAARGAARTRRRERALLVRYAAQDPVRPRHGDAGAWRERAGHRLH